MPRPIKPTEETINKMVEEFKSMLTNAKMQDGELKYEATWDYTNCKDKVEIAFEPTAFLKMYMLIQDFDSEIAWHGVVERDGDKKFIVKDIIVYPQEVTGVTVVTDQKEYTDWLYALDDDTFSKVRFQGHSHVNMAVSPSSTDETGQQGILKQLRDDDYYIFMIWNKKLSRYARVYDLKNNTLYMSEDVIVTLTDGTDLSKFLKSSKSAVKKEEKKYTYNNKSYSELPSIDDEESVFANFYNKNYLYD